MFTWEYIMWWILCPGPPVCSKTRPPSTHGSSRPETRPSPATAEMRRTFAAEIRTFDAAEMGIRRSAAFFIVWIGRYAAPSVEMVRTSSPARREGWEIRLHGWPATAVPPLLVLIVHVNCR
jgi:hypothetical protein